MLSTEQFVELEKDPVGRLDKKMPFAIKHVIVVRRILRRRDVTEWMGDKTTANYYRIKTVKKTKNSKN